MYGCECECRCTRIRNRERISHLTFKFNILSFYTEFFLHFIFSLRFPILCYYLSASATNSGEKKIVKLPNAGNGEMTAHASMQNSKWWPTLHEREWHCLKKQKLEEQKSQMMMMMMRKHQIEIMHIRAFRQLLTHEHCDGILTFKCIRRSVVHV